MNNKTDNNSLDKLIVILEKFYHITACSGQEGKKVSLTKQNDPKQNYFSSANPKYKPHVLIAANNKIYRTIRKELFIVFYNIKCQMYSNLSVQTSCAIPVYLGISKLVL